MIKKIIGLTQNPLFTGSFVMIMGTNLANFFAYLYHLIFGRYLGPSVYGDMVAIVSVTGYFVSIFAFLGVSIVKFASAGGEGEISDIFSFIQKKLVMPIFVISLLFLTITPSLSYFLKIDALTLIFVGPIIFFTFLNQIYTSFLQGRLDFGKTVVTINSSWIVRIGIGLVFFYIGWSLFGVIAAYFISVVFMWLLSKKFVGKIKINPNYDKKIGRKLGKFALPVLIMSLSATSFITTDVVLVKHYLEPFSSGIYSSLSMLGKIIIYGSAPIAYAMFPIVSKRVANGKGTKYLFLLSFIMAFIISSIVLLLYYLFPEIVINMLYGSEYLAAAPYLVWFGVFSLIYTLNYVLMNYFLSRSNTASAYFVFVGALIQALGIIVFHNSLMSVIFVSIAASALVFIILLIYGFMNYGFVFGFYKIKEEVRTII